MAVTSRYTEDYTRDIVTVEKIGAVGALCKTSYGAEITVNWGTNIPSPVPTLGERWYVQRISPSRWAFESKITGTSYSIMRCAIALDMASCVGRERPTVDYISSIGVSEVYLTVAGGGVVYWDSEVAADYGLMTCDVDDKPFDYVGQVVRRCRAAGISVVFVIGCDLWSDVQNPVHNYYQQVRLSDDYISSADSQGYVGRDGSAEHVATWSFVTARQAVGSLVAELYSRYGDDVRGVCFDGWCVNGAYADASDYVNGEFVKDHPHNIYEMLVVNRFSSMWWSRRRELASFYGRLQSDFIDGIKSSVGNWPISAMVPSSVLCLSSERVGDFDTWVGDDFALFGWSQVCCMLDYSRSVDRNLEFCSFEYLVACMQRFAEGATPVYGVPISTVDNYEGLFSVLAKYNVTNVLIGDYESVRSLSEQQLTSLRSAINSNSVTAMTTTSEFGVLLSSNSRSVTYYDDFDFNRFSRQAQDFCMSLLDKLPHRMRVYYDRDVENPKNLSGISSLVLFHSLNMSDKAITSIKSVVGGKNIVVVGRCGMYPLDGVIRRNSMPFVDMFGASDYGSRVYRGVVSVSGGNIGAFDSVYVMDGRCVGIAPVVLDRGGGFAIASCQDGDDDLVAPIFANGRSFDIAMDIIDEQPLLDMASEMVLVAVGRSE